MDHHPPQKLTPFDEFADAIAMLKRWIRMWWWTLPLCWVLIVGHGRLAETAYMLAGAIVLGAWLLVVVAAQSEPSDKKDGPQ